MFLRVSRCLLYTLQLVVLSKMVAAYLNSISNTQSPSPLQTAPSTPQTVPASPFLLPKTAPENDWPNSRINKPSVRMKPISMTYLREHLTKVSSRFDLVKLFTDEDEVDTNLDRWISRTLQSASDTRMHRPHQAHGLGKVKSQTTTNLPEIIPFHKVIDEPTSENWEPMDESTASDTNIISEESEEVPDEKNAEDSDYFMDYSQEESSEGDFEAFEAALHHMEEVTTCSSSRCRQPTPFVLSVRDPQDSTRVFLPECVVLHRCLNYSGCCGDSNHECVPKSMSIVTKAFLVVNRLVTGGELVTFHPKMATTISFVNHTECECREKPKLTKCTKSCPKPLRLTQEGVNCVCDCFPQANRDNWPCDRVKEGVAPLSHDGLICVKNGNCYIPRCSAGEFDIHTGLCPLSDEFALPAFLFGNPNDRRFYRSHLQSFDFSNLPGRISSTTNGLSISPTPSSFSGGLAHTQHHTLESLTSRTVPTDSTPIRASYEVRDSFQNRKRASVYSVSDLESDSEQSTAESDDTSLLISNETEQLKSNLSDDKSINNLQSSHPNSFEDITKFDESNIIDDAFYSDEEASEFDESQRKGEDLSDVVETDRDSQTIKDSESVFVHFSTDVKFAVKNIRDTDTSDGIESPHYEAEDSTLKTLHDDDDEETATSSPQMYKHITTSHITTLSSLEHATEKSHRQTVHIDNTKEAFNTSPDSNERFLAERARLRAHNQALDVRSNSNSIQAPSTASSSTLSISSSPSSSSPSSVFPFSSKLSSTSQITSHSPSSFLKSLSSLSSTTPSKDSSPITPTHIPHNTMPPDSPLDNVALASASGEVPTQNPP